MLLLVWDGSAPFRRCALRSCQSGVWDFTSVRYSPTRAAEPAVMGDANEVPATLNSSSLVPRCRAMMSSPGASRPTSNEPHWLQEVRLSRWSVAPTASTLGSPGLVATLPGTGLPEASVLGKMTVWPA